MCVPTDGADDRPDGEQREHRPVDLVVEGVADHAGEPDRQHRGERRAVGQLLGDAESDHHRRDHQDPAADAEEPGEEPGGEPHGDRPPTGRNRSPVRLRT